MVLTIAAGIIVGVLGLIVIAAFLAILGGWLGEWLEGWAAQRHQRGQALMEAQEASRQRYEAHLEALEAKGQRGERASVRLTLEDLQRDDEEQEENARLQGRQ